MHIHNNICNIFICNILSTFYYYWSIYNLFNKILSAFMKLAAVSFNFLIRYQVNLTHSWWLTHNLVTMTQNSQYRPCSSIWLMYIYSWQIALPQMMFVWHISTRLENPIQFFIAAAALMYHRQQNKCYPQRCLLAHFEGTLDFNNLIT